MLTIPRFLLPPLLRLHKWAESRPYFHIGADGPDQYMRRFWVVGYHSASRNVGNTAWHGTARGRLHAWLTDRFAIRAHTILRSDHDRALHDHPVDSISIVLEGGYYEVCEPNDHCRANPRSYKYLLKHLSAETPGAFTFYNAQFNVHWRGPGSVVRRSAEAAHRLVLPRGKTAKTLWIMGAKRKSWSFFPDGKPVPWRQYLGLDA